MHQEPNPLRESRLAALRENHGVAELAELSVGDPPDAWGSVGFRLSGESCHVGRVAIRLVGTREGSGLLALGLDGFGGGELDGLPVATTSPADHGAAQIHPNGTIALDHVVAFTPDLDRTVSACEAAGLDLRRVREGPTPAGAERQAFFRLGEAILEVVEHPPDSPAAADRDAPARLWGLAFAVEDLDATAGMLGPLLGEPREAVQPGRRIATLRRTSGLTVPVVFMSAAP